MGKDLSVVYVSDSVWKSNNYSKNDLSWLCVVVITIA